MRVYFLRQECELSRLLNGGLAQLERHGHVFLVDIHDSVLVLCVQQMLVRVVKG